MEIIKKNMSVVRRAHSADIPGIVRLLIEFSNYHHQLSPFYRKGDAMVPFLEKRVEAVLSNKEELLLVVDVENSLSGFLIGRIVSGSAYVMVQQFGYIEIVYLKEGYRGHGLGRALIDEASKILRAKGATHLELTVDVRNHRGSSAWLGMGFEAYQQRMIKSI